MNAIELAYRKFCEERFPLPNEAQVSDLEKRIGVRLPPDYRRFILEYNGGYFREAEITPAIEGCPVNGLDFMGGIGASHRSAELASQRSLALFDDNDPPQILPIGYTLMGNLIFLVTHPEDNGTIGLKIAFTDQSFHLAKSIEAFFGLLHERVARR